MRHPAVLCFLLLLVLSGCENVHNGAAQNRVVKNELVMQLNVHEPNDFVQEYFNTRRPRDVAKSNLDVAAIDQSSIVDLAGNGGVTNLPCELVAVTRTSDSISVGLNSQPMSLANAVTSARAICELVGLPHYEIDSWFNNKRHEDILEANCAQRGSVNRRHHSVEIRGSFETARPWRILYTITYDLPTS